MSVDATVMATLATFLKATSGLVVTPDKAYLVTSRLMPIATQHSCRTIADLVTKLTSGTNPALRQDVVEAMTTNETSFFRDTAPFEIFKGHILPALLERRKAQKSFRILCAAASSGQEPYSLAILLAENSLRLSGWSAEITGIDIDAKILKRAEEAAYTQFEVQRGLPIQLLMKYFDKSEESWRLKPTVRGMVKFRKRNLLESMSDLGRFDVIFCRNVLIYFDTPTKKEVLNRLADQVAPDGYLFLGGAETVLDVCDRFTTSPGHRGLYLPGEPVPAARVASLGR